MQLTSGSSRWVGACPASDSVQPSSLFVNAPRLERAFTSTRPLGKRSSLAARQKPGNILAAQGYVTGLLGKRRTEGLPAIPQHWKDHVAKMGSGKQKALHGYFRLVQQINDREPELQRLTDAELKAKTAEFKHRLSKGATLDDILVEAFAVVREVSARVLRLRHYDAQMVGGIVLHNGSIAEMKTGEGKTLVATLPAYLNALTGKGVHVITVNDYLAERDANWMGKIYRFLGLSVAVVKSTDTPLGRGPLFKCDIVYVTAQSLCFTYLQDNTALDKNLVAIRRPFNYALVDEVDSLLIDEGRNPMLINKSIEPPAERFELANKIINELKQEVRDDKGRRYKNAPTGHFWVSDRPFPKVHFTDLGYNELLTQLFKHDQLEVGEGKDAISPVRLWQDGNRVAWGPYLLNALKAKYLYLRNRDYIVSEQKEVKIVNPVTGRVMPISRWGDNLHQAVEAKEGVPLKGDSMTQASVTYQCFFRYYDKLAGMTGTASTEAPEFFDVYGLNVIEIPSRLPNMRIDHSARLFPYRADRLVSLFLIVMEAYCTGRPVLIGTASVEESMVIDTMLDWPLDQFQHEDHMALKKAEDPRLCLIPGGNDRYPDGYFSKGVVQCTLDKGWSPIRGLDSARDRVAAIHRKMLNAKPENVRKESHIIAQAGLPRSVTIATNMAGRGTDIVLGGNPKGLALWVLQKFFARRLLTGDELTAYAAELDDIPLPSFNWPFIRNALARSESKEGNQLGLDIWDNFRDTYLQQRRAKPLPDKLLELMQKADMICSTREANMKLEEAQRALAKVLDRADSLLAQVVAQHWAVAARRPGDAFDVRIHGAEALTELDRLFENDLIPDLSQSYAADLKDVSKTPGGPVGVPVTPPTELKTVYQKSLAWAAGHVLIYLEQQCQGYAKQVKKAGGLLVIGTNLQDSRRSENQLRGRAARQGDAGETLMMYDMQDQSVGESLFQQVTEKMYAKGSDDGTEPPYLEGVLANKFLTTIYQSLESQGRASRYEVRKFDEIMEEFRRHVYSLRHLILSGTIEQNNDVLRRYFQDQADEWVEQLIDCNQSPQNWNWEKLRTQVNLLFPPEPPAPAESPKPQLTISLPQSMMAALQSQSNPPQLSIVQANGATTPLHISSVSHKHDQASSNGSAPTADVGLMPPGTSSHSDTQQPAVSVLPANAMQHSTDGHLHATQEPSQQQPVSQASVREDARVNGNQLLQQQQPSAVQAASEQSGSTPGNGAPPRQQSGADGNPQLAIAHMAQALAAAATFDRMVHQQSEHTSSDVSTSSQHDSSGDAPSEDRGSKERKSSDSRQTAGVPVQVPANPSLHGTELGQTLAKAAQYKGVFMHFGGLDRETIQQLQHDLSQGLPLKAPLPFKVDLQYKAKVAAHRKMLKDLDKSSGVRSRLKGPAWNKPGWYATHAEQLRDWLGEFLVAKYDEREQIIDTKKAKMHIQTLPLRDMMLRTLDDIWMHFLRDMTGLQAGVPLRSFSRMDPEQEFRLDAGAAFLDVLTTFKQECVCNALKPVKIGYNAEVIITPEQYTALNGQNMNGSKQSSQPAGASSSDNASANDGSQSQPTEQNAPSERNSDEAKPKESAPASMNGALAGTTNGAMSGSFQGHEEALAGSQVMDPVSSQ